MRIGILGTRGIPNHYGGFEQWAELLSEGLVNRGCEVYVYNSHNHPYEKKIWNGVHIIHKYDPEYKIGTVGQFIYDLNCILDSRKRNFDIILQLGFTSSSIWGWLQPRKNTFIACNMDGIEWVREKYSKPVQTFLKYAEKLAVRFSDCLIADSPVIEDYYNENYSKTVKYISYGTNIFNNEDQENIKEFNVKPYQYNLLISRLEPENNIETIIKGVLKSNSAFPLLIVGSHKTPHGQYLFEKYSERKKIQFINSIYNLEILNNLRYFSNIYFHGHSVGGTNPSLLEAMACSARIFAHDNPYNRSALDNNGEFFSSSEQISTLLNDVKSKKHCGEYLKKNLHRINDVFLTEKVIDQYYNLFNKNI